MKTNCGHIEDALVEFYDYVRTGRVGELHIVLQPMAENVIRASRAVILANSRTRRVTQLEITAIAKAMVIHVAELEGAIEIIKHRD